MSALVDQYGQPLRRETLTREIAGPTLAGVRSPVAGYPADGLDPSRLAGILREADHGEPLRYFELAETIEERDLHYAAVLGTRKRSVAQIDITVEAASDSAEDVRRADLVREWLRRDELASEIFDMLDAIGKGVSFNEIIWDQSAGQWWPARMEWRDPRWFTFDRADLRRPMLRGGIDGGGQAEALPAFKFVVAQIKAKSGLPVRGGIARLAAWAWMFKAYTQRDWAIFTQTYGQPIRIGKFHEGATKEDRATLFRAVANIAGDCAAIVPESMAIEFIEAKNVGAGSDLYKQRADWLDQQISKGVLGQTTTTDAISGGHAVSQEHRQVQEDIETSDCKDLSAVINRDLIRPWMDLEFGPPANGRGAYPRLLIARPKREDLAQLTQSLGVLVPLGLRVSASEVRDKFGLAEPDAKEELLTPPRAAEPPPTAPAPAGSVALQAQEARDKPSAASIAATALQPAEAAIGAMVDQIGVMVDKAGDLAELQLMLASAWPDMQAGDLAKVIAGGMAAAQAAGRSDVEESNHG